jgi:hypothetical protein
MVNKKNLFAIDVGTHWKEWLTFNLSKHGSLEETLRSDIHNYIVITHTGLLDLMLDDLDTGFIQALELLGLRVLDKNIFDPA